MKTLVISPSITPRETENINRYFQDISSTCPLEPDQEVELAHRIRQGDLEARNELVTANLRFVVSVAKQYQHLGAALEDLINEGNIGLIRAAENFDPTKGFKFSTYAVWWIRQAILGFIAERARTVRLPQNVNTQLCRMRLLANRFEQEHERQPSADELAQLLSLSEERVNDYLVAANCTTSLDAPVSFDSSTTVGEMVEDAASEPADRALLSESLRHDLLTAIASLSPREQTVLHLYFGLDGESLSLDQIATELHLSRERVRQLVEQSTAKIRKTYGAALLQYV